MCVCVCVYVYNCACMRVCVDMHTRECAARECVSEQLDVFNFRCCMHVLRHRSGKNISSNLFLLYLVQASIHIVHAIDI